MKLKDKTTLLIGTLAGILSGYQKEKLEQEYIKKQLKKTLRKYWQLAGNVEIVYGVMDHISWKLLAQTLDSKEEYDRMMSLYNEDGLTDEQKEERQALVEKAQANLNAALEVAEYNNKVTKHKDYVLKLNVLGVDVKLTAEVLNERITVVEAYINLLQTAINSFAGGKDNAVVGKFNSRLKNFTKRLLNVVEYINDNYPEEEFELNATEDKNSFTNPIFNDDIITSDESDATKRFYTDFANANGELIPDGKIDKNDVIILKALIKNLYKLSKEDKDALVKAIDVNGDGFLNSDDSDWLTSYVQDQEDINKRRENGEYVPYYEHTLSDQVKDIISGVINGTENDEPTVPEEPVTQTIPSSTGYLYNNNTEVDDEEQSVVLTELTWGAYVDNDQTIESGKTGNIIDANTLVAHYSDGHTEDVLSNSTITVSDGSIDGNVITAPEVSEDTEVTITATYQELTATITYTAKYVEQGGSEEEPPVDDSI